MRKIVIQRTYGAFNLSAEACKLMGVKEEDIYNAEIPRDDPRLIEVVEELGDKASGEGSSLMIVEIPDDVEWEIDDYDGMEWVAEKHRRWP